MSENKVINENNVNEAPKDLVRGINEQVNSIMAHMQKKHPENAWMTKVQQAYWSAIQNAHKEGKKLILCGTNIPTELVYAFDAVPFVIETAIIRIATTPEPAKYLDLADKYVISDICGIDRGIIGFILSGEITDMPDAILYTVVPCDSARVAYPAMQKQLGIPGFCIDTPYRKDARGYQYIADQLRDMVKFMEEITGNKLDWNKFLEILKLGNKAAQLLTDCSKLRENIPCPLPGRFLVLNELTAAMMGSQDVIDFLEEEYALGIKNLEAGTGVTPGPEEFRCIWLQNMMWSNAGILDWMEKKYNAVVVMDAFGYQGYYIIDLKNEETVFNGLARRVLGIPMIHGCSGPAEPWIEVTEDTIRRYSIDVSMFAGHVGCKHTWAAAKLVKDYVYEKFNLPTLTFDLDGIDVRYKSGDEVKAIISEYMDTLIENRKKLSAQEG